MGKKKTSIHFENPVLLVENVQKSKDFYLNLFHQEIKHDFGRNVTFSSGLSIWQKEYAINLINEEIEKDQKIEETNLNKRENNQMIELYFESDDLEDFERSLRKKEVKFAHGTIVHPWQQKAFRIFDPDGNLIEVAESMESVVTRLANRGFNPKEIHTKSMMPVETIRKILGQTKKPKT